jgi:hypothetical protein
MYHSIGTEVAEKRDGSFQCELNPGISLSKLIVLAPELHSSLLLFVVPHLALPTNHSCHRLTVENKHVCPRFSRNPYLRIFGLVAPNASHIA